MTQRKLDLKTDPGFRGFVFNSDNSNFPQMLGFAAPENQKYPQITQITQI